MISMNIVVNLYLPSYHYCTQQTKFSTVLMCTTFSDSNARQCHEFGRSILAANTCILDAQTRMGIHIPMPQATHLVHACACGVLAHGRGMGMCIPIHMCASRMHESAAKMMRPNS